MTPEVAEQLIGLWRDGLSQSTIADRQETTESVTSERIKLLRARGVDLSARRAPPTWTQASILRALRLWADQHGRLPNCADWRQASDGHPSVVTVWRHFHDQGGWAGAIRTALEADGLDN